jgi:hypothetical protein
VAQHLHGTAAKVAIVELPGLGSRVADHGPDVSDWLDLGNQRENLSYIAEQAREWTPPTPKEGWRAHVFTAASLKDRKFEPISYVVPMLIPEGVTILAGKPKVGKSWAALDIALAKAGGRFVFGDIKLEEGDVLYAALEDNERRLRSRVERIVTQGAQQCHLGSPSPRNGVGSMLAAWVMRRIGPRASRNPGSSSSTRSQAFAVIATTRTPLMRAIIGR